jgi:hypothetical protein
MKYEVQHRNDFLTGAYLVVRIPENELDQCALHTIQTDCPNFIIPFHYKSSDGQIELVYKVGTLGKLHYFSGDLPPQEYAELWQSLLKPLLDCADWFMNPCSFVLDVDYLYYDKSNKTISYVYIPSAYRCSDYDAFYEMAVDVSKMMTVSDTLLENKVLKAIMNDFNPALFLRMLKDYITGTHDLPQSLPVFEYRDEPELPAKIASAGKKLETKASNHGAGGSAEPGNNDKTDDADIEVWQDIKLEQNKKEKETGGYKFFGRKRKEKKMTQNQRSLPEPPLNLHPEQADKNQMEVIDITQSASTVLSGTGLRYIGQAHLPPSIQIIISEGEIFTIGRFDAAIGKKQSNFEFERKTKAVSRRHAVIERDIEGYKIVDLSSSAGTFVNDKKIPPNTPYGLETGCRVSFGNSGADYVWEAN